MLTVEGSLVLAGVVAFVAALGWALLQRRAQSLPWPRPRIYRAVFLGQTLFLTWSLLKLPLLLARPTLFSGGSLQLLDGALGLLGLGCTILIAGGIGRSPPLQGGHRPRPGRGGRARYPGPWRAAGADPRPHPGDPAQRPRPTRRDTVPPAWPTPGRRGRHRRDR